VVCAQVCHLSLPVARLVACRPHEGCHVSALAIVIPGVACNCPPVPCVGCRYVVFSCVLHPYYHPWHWILSSQTGCVGDVPHDRRVDVGFRQMVHSA
jgi:hypothetical protein